MQLLVVGVNHRTTPIALRERVALPGEEAVSAARSLLGRSGISEAMGLSTCNRVEMYLATDEPLRADRSVAHLLGERADVPVETLEDHLYVHRDFDAVHHIFRVASSLDSMVVGEPQITGQLKQAWRDASAIDAVGPNLDYCLRQAFHVAKRVRTETEIGENAVSLAYVAVELASQIFGRLDGKRGLLLGAGKMSSLAARHLRGQGAQLVITNRSMNRAEALADELGGSARPLEMLTKLLTDADIVISSTSAPGWVLTHEAMQGIVKARRNRPLFLIDLAVPRDVEPRVNEIDNIYLYDVDDMQRVMEQNRAARERAAKEAGGMVEEEAHRFMRRLRRRDVVPTIVALREQFHDVAAAELERFERSHDELNRKQRKDAQKMVRRIVNKVLHSPTVNLKRASEGGDPGELVDALETLFELDDDDAATEPERKLELEKKPARKPAT